MHSKKVFSANSSMSHFYLRDDRSVVLFLSSLPDVMVTERTQNGIGEDSEEKRESGGKMREKWKNWTV